MNCFTTPTRRRGSLTRQWNASPTSGRSSYRRPDALRRWSDHRLATSGECANIRNGIRRHVTIVKADARYRRWRPFSSPVPDTSQIYTRWITQPGRDPDSRSQIRNRNRGWIGRSTSSLSAVFTAFYRRVARNVSRHLIGVWDVTSKPLANYEE